MTSWCSSAPTRLGGTWRDNIYPGAACDIPSDLYSFSFAPNPDWTHRYPSQPELLAYLQRVAADFGVTPKIRFGAELIEARWDAAAAEWDLTTSGGRLRSRVLVSGTGPFVDPAWPDIPGLEGFTGERVHSSRWDPELDTTGRSVGVIGTGASAIQLVPELQKTSGSLTVFQRTPAWVIPRGDRVTSMTRRNLFRRFPALQRIARGTDFVAAEAKFPAFASPLIGRIGGALYGLHRRQVRDRELRARLTPHYRIGCKRILISSTFYPAMSQPNVTLVTDPIVRVDGSDVVTADGTRHRLDVLVCATGFTVTRPAIAHRIHGREGLTLADAWAPHMTALRGTTVAGFPNLFLLIGPNTALGHNSMVYVIEAQIEYVLQALAARGAGGALEPLPRAQQAYESVLQKHMARSVWMTGGCASYYVDAAGRNTALWPHTAARFARTIARFDRAEYLTT